MGLVKLVLSSLFVLSLCIAQSPAFSMTCESILDNRELHIRRLIKKVKYKRIDGLRVPYLDLNPKAKKTVVLVSGFSKSMLSWVDQIKLLTEQGYRVIAIENSNIGLNLKENGLLDLENNMGINFDAEILKQLVLKLKPKGEIKFVGHSRGGAVVARASEFLLGEVKVSKLYLFSPYVDYIWDHSFFTSMSSGWFINFYPASVGASLDSASKYSLVDDLIDLPNSLRHKGYAYTLKGVQPHHSGERFILSETLEELKNRSRTQVQIVGVEVDREFSPSHLVRPLSGGAIVVDILEDEGLSHYWPLDSPVKANKIIND